MNIPEKTLDYQYIIFDLETTGLDVEKDYIVEIAALFIKTGEKFHRYIMPPGKGIIGGAEFHGLTRDILREKAAKDTKAALADFLDWVYRTASTEKPLCFIAHNNFGYDQLILENEYLRNRMEMINCFYADSCPLFKEMRKFVNGKLSTIYETLFGKKLKNAHTAEADVAALYASLQTVPDWKDNIPIRIATYRVDDSNLAWIQWMLEEKHVSDLKLYGYTSMAKMVEGVNKYGTTYQKLLIEMFDNWIGKRVYGQLRHVIRHQMRKEPHRYLTRSKFPTGI